MVTALLLTVVFGLIAILLSLENDKLRKNSALSKKSEDDRIYKFSVFSDVSEKIAYEKDAEKIIDLIMTSLRNFYSYSLASSLIVKDAHLILKFYVEEDIGSEYLKKVEESMLSSFEKLVGRVPSQIERKTFGLTLDDSIKSTYSSSFHLPLIAKNKVLALIHLSSKREEAFRDTTDLQELIEKAASSLTHFSKGLEEETGKFMSLVESISDGIIMIDNRNNLLIINNFAKKILGIALENPLLVDILNAFPKSFNLELTINRVLSGNSPYTEKGVALNNKVVDVFIAPVGNDKVSIVLHDMTKYKKKEMLKEDLTNIMVHELRSPVTTMKDSAELIITSKDTLTEEKKLKFLEIIHQQAKKVLGQIGSILDTAKLDAGKLVLQKTKGDLVKVIKEEIQTFAPVAERKSISLTFDVLNPLPQIFFDEIRISQVIDNLLSNSLKFTPENGKIKVEIDYKTIPPVLDGVSPMGEFLSLDKYIVVSVSDTGIGISKDQQKFLFSKYTQAENTSEKVSTQGTGLGLYLIKGIVESHGGRVWVKSEPGSGTTFSFSLPSTDDSKTSYDAPKLTTTPLAKLSQTSLN